MSKSLALNGMLGALLGLTGLSFGGGISRPLLGGLGGGLDPAMIPRQRTKRRTHRSGDKLARMASEGRIGVGHPR
jgi:hypothetical protein